MRFTVPRIALAVAAPWLLWAFGRTLALDRVYPLVAVVAFTPYAALTALVPVVVALALRRWILALVTTLAAVLLIVAVLPRALGAPGRPAGAGEQVVTVMSSNLLLGQARTASVVDLARRHGVDVLSLVELSPDALNRLDAAGGRRLLPHRIAEPRPGGPGSAVLSRRPLLPVVGTLGREASQPAADIELRAGPPLRVMAVHPQPPVTRAGSRSWRAILGDLPSPREAPGLSVLAGDFNATLDHRDFRRLLDRGWRDAADAVGAGLRPTWPVGRTALPITIDHVLVGPGIRVRSFTTHEIPGSDHRAVIAELVIGAR